VVGELDFDDCDEFGDAKLRIIDRVTNLLELYVNGDSVW
jgi:hypothetical protein